MQSQIANRKSQIVVVGAGPAGTSAAIRLALQGFGVTLVEREKFPRRKLCGEFISPECFAHFRALGVLDEMMAAGGDRIRETVFYAPDGKSVSIPSKWFGKDEKALGLSRAEMDFRLLKRARAVGVTVLEETQVACLLVESGGVRGIKAKSAGGEFFEIATDLTIDATGRAGVLAKMAERDFLTSNRQNDHKIKVVEKSAIQFPKAKFQNRLVGFKAHFKNAKIERGRCEIYFFRGGYGGLNLVEGGAANHCFLIRADVVREFGGDAGRIVREVVFKNKRAFETLKNAVPVDDWLAVTIDDFGLKNLTPAPNLISVGDAGAFIDPFTGSGMLMAFESAEILAQAILAAAAENSFSPEKIAETYKFHHARKFQRRLRLCAALRQAAFAPKLAKLAISILSFGDLPGKILTRATRRDFLPFNK